MMRRTITRAAITAALTLAAAAQLAAQTPWSWQGRLQPGQQLEVAGVQGNVRAVPARGPEARVVATVTARAGDADAVRMVALEHAGGVTICAVYPSPPDHAENECASDGGLRNINVRNVDITVDFEVEVPAGVRFTGRTIDGEVHATDLTGRVHASSISGDVVVRTSGHATAATVSGDIDVSMGALEENASFTTVSGRITVRVTGDLDANVRVTTLSGRIESDYPITLVRGGSRGLEGTIGGGGRSLNFTTVSGDIELRRR